MRRGAMLLSVLLGLGLEGDRLPAEGAEKFDSARLLRMCEARQGDTEWLTCVAYFRGYGDAMVASQFGQKYNKAKVCVPEGLSGEQTMLVVMKFMREKPEVFNVGPSYVSYAAFQAAFPCPQP